MKNKYKKQTKKKLAIHKDIANAKIINEEDYEFLFIRKSPISARQGKTSYLRKEFFRRIQVILQMYSNPDLSVSAYIDAVLEHHFETYKKDIIEIHNKRYIPPFDE